MSEQKKPKILFISAEYTGHGHKSVHTALMQGFRRLYGGAIECTVVDGFLLGGNILVWLERLYNTCVKYLPWLWRMLFEFSERHKDYINRKMSRSIREKFLHIIDDYKPDLIVSLHPVFTGCVLDILEGENIKIPFYILITDLTTISDIWIDGRADKIFAASQVTANYILQSGINKEKIITIGLPVREGFESPIQNKEDIIKSTNTDGRMQILLLNNSEKAARLIRIVKGLYDRFDCDVTIVCGRSKGTFATLTRFFHLYSHKPTIIGYTEELNKLFLSCDVLITRSGSITVAEAINCLIPIVSMGALPGQEEGNPPYIDKNGLGFRALYTDDIFNKIELLARDGRKRLVETRLRQFDYHGKGAREKAVRLIANDLLQ